MRKDQSLFARMAAGAGAVLLAAGLNAGTAAADPAPAEVQVAEKLNQLGGETLGRLTGKHGDTTVVLSPYGLGSALHLLLLGAPLGTPSEASLKGELLPAGIDVLKQDPVLAALNKSVLGANGDKIKLTLASAVFVPTSAKTSQTFKVRADKAFAAPVESLDFKGTGALEHINGWVKAATHDMVPRILDELDPNARFVLANAVYFNAAWENAFDPKRTAKAPFKLVNDKTRDVDMMDALLPVEHAELDGLNAVWLPYDGRDVAMLIIAPGAEEKPTKVAEVLKAKSVSDLIAEAQKQVKRGSVQIRLPRFRAESFLDLTDVLPGKIKAALATSSNYDAINKGKAGPLLVVQRAVVEVSEAGTRAAAATAVASDRSLSVTPVLSADKPFVFAIVHRPTQAILFTGYVADPGEGPKVEKAAD